MNENVTFLGLALLAPSARQQEWSPGMIRRKD